MGMHLGFIAVECSVQELREAFIGFSKHFEMKASKTDCGDASELHEWAQEYEMANAHIFSFFDDSLSCFSGFRSLSTVVYSLRVT